MYQLMLPTLTFPHWLSQHSHSRLAAYSDKDCSKNFYIYIYCAKIGKSPNFTLYNNIMERVLSHLISDSELVSDCVCVTQDFCVHHFLFVTHVIHFGCNCTLSCVFACTKNTYHNVHKHNFRLQQLKANNTIMHESPNTHTHKSDVRLHISKIHVQVMR